VRRKEPEEENEEEEGERKKARKNQTSPQSYGARQVASPKKPAQIGANKPKRRIWICTQTERQASGVAELMHAHTDKTTRPQKKPLEATRIVKEPT
jgi:hypothetical protein